MFEEVPAVIVYTGFTWVQLLTLLVSVVLPALVALVTRRETTPGIKAVTLAALAAVLGLLSELLTALRTDQPYDLGAALAAWVTSFVVAVVVHYGLLKPTGITGTDGAIAAAVPGGVGRHAADRPRPTA